MKKTPLLAGFLFWSLIGFGQVDVLTYHYDNARTGQNIQETILTPTNVKQDFGKLFSQLVDGDVYAQPLYVHNVAIPGKGTHNVVFVATEADSVYAFDADYYNGGKYLWKATLLDQAHGPAGPTRAGLVVRPPYRGLGVHGWRTPAPPDVYCTNIEPFLGITSTPVIDSSHNTMYVNAVSKEGASIVYRLHALDITTGTEKPSWPIVIAGTVNGIHFDALYQLDRAGLLLINGTLYVGFGPHCDLHSYHGWIFAYDVTTPTPSLKGIFNTSPRPNINLDGAGIWMEGAGLAADSNGNLFVATANGLFDTIPDAHGFPINKNYGDSILKLDPNLNVLDYFTPHNQDFMNGPCDLDLGSGGVLLLPDQPGIHKHMLVQAGKVGTIYLIDRDQMTTNNQHYCSNCGGVNTNIAQELANEIGVMGVPAYWNEKVYFRGTKLAPFICAPWRGDDYVLKAFSLNNGKLTTPPVRSSDNDYAGNVTVSANSNTNGIVWALTTDINNGNKYDPAVLKAYDGVSLNLLYSSDWTGGPADFAKRDLIGPSLTFTTPVVANGKVYVGSRSDVQSFPSGTIGQLSVFGLLPVKPPHLVKSPPPFTTVTISPPDLSYEVRVETKCTESIAGLCVHREIVRTCVGGNCFDVPSTSPRCVICDLALSVAVGAILGIGALLLMRRRKLNRTDGPRP